MDSFHNPPARSNGSHLSLVPSPRRRRRLARMLLALLRGPWLLQAAAVLLFAVILGVLTVLLLNRV